MRTTVPPASQAAAEGGPAAARRPAAVINVRGELITAWDTPGLALLRFPGRTRRSPPGPRARPGHCATPPRAGPPAGPPRRARPADRRGGHRRHRAGRCHRAVGAAPGRLVPGAQRNQRGPGQHPEHRRNRARRPRDSATGSSPAARSTRSRWRPGPGWWPSRRWDATAARARWRPGSGTGAASPARSPLAAGPCSAGRPAARPSRPGHPPCSPAARCCGWAFRSGRPRPHRGLRGAADLRRPG